MAYVEYNINPSGNRVGDCVIRAVGTVLGTDWDSAYIDVLLEGFVMKDMPSSNHVWGSYLVKRGFRRTAIPNTCPRCYTVRDFCRDHPTGRFILATGTHVIAVIDGDYYDTWDSGDEVPVYYFERRK